MANDELVGKVRRCRDPNIGPRNSGDGVRPPREEKERRPKNARMALLLLWSIVNKQLAKNEVDLSELLKDEFSKYHSYPCARSLGCFILTR
ncbi:hypothetical protein HPP92_027081 [Vanilla planifolia]|uniref:Uncharacterized protein n=1 Tax=Vanilla planifolia TaxID=51239 RepID=A0A835PAH7_VANPL|nr:hypothetical protein HPP92_027081 [Vanilla planifolia]